MLNAPRAVVVTVVDVLLSVYGLPANEDTLRLGVDLVKK